jgi:SAM-dependent methyltransferase
MKYLNSGFSFLSPYLTPRITTSLDKSFDPYLFQKQMYSFVLSMMHMSYVDETVEIKLLEVNCNYGGGLKFFEQTRCKEIYGIDNNPDYVEIAKQNVTRSNITLGDPYNLNFDCKFHHIVSIENPPENLNLFLNNCKDKLEDNGNIVLGLPYKKLPDNWGDFNLQKSFDITNHVSIGCAISKTMLRNKDDVLYNYLLTRDNDYNNGLKYGLFILNNN